MKGIQVLAALVTVAAALPAMPIGGRDSMSINMHTGAENNHDMGIENLQARGMQKLQDHGIEKLPLRDTQKLQDHDFKKLPLRDMQKLQARDIQSIPDHRMEKIHDRDTQNLQDHDVEEHQHSGIDKRDGNSITLSSLPSLSDAEMTIPEVRIPHVSVDTPNHQPQTDEANSFESENLSLHTQSAPADGIIRRGSHVVPDAELGIPMAKRVHANFNEIAQH